MFDHGDHMNGWGWGWGVLMMILVVVVIGLVVWLIVRSTQQTSSAPHDRVREILAERLARGEISQEEYRELSKQF
jgi:putative membrane protein